MGVNDELFSLEAELAKYPGTTHDDARNRRMILRETLNRVRDMGYKEGYSDAIRDEGETRVLAQRAQDLAERKAAADG